MTLNCVVVDDSAIQRLSIVKLIENHSSLNLIAEYSSALETKNGLNTHKVDLIFLDIEMPVLNGFELLDVLNNKPQIIFVTGKTCLLYTSPSPRDATLSRMPSSA